MLIIIFFVILVTSILINQILDIKQYVTGLLSIFLFSFSNVVIACTIAGVLKQLDNPYLFTAIHCIIFLVTLVVWSKKNPICFKDLVKITSFFKDHFSNDCGLSLFFLAIIISIIFQFILIFIMPPNTHDSLTTHMSRIGYWLQNKTFLLFNIHNIRNIYYPMNPAFQVVWIIVYTGNDTLVEISQVIAMLVCATSIYGISRILNRSKKSALFNSLLFLSFPIVIMQGTTTQTDLVVAALIACTFYFLFLGFKEEQFKYLTISGLGIALALGSKQTALFTIPGYILIFFFLWQKNQKAFPRSAIQLISITLLFFLFFGILTYIINFFHFKGIFGPPGSIESQLSFSNIQDVIEILKINILRLTYNFFDPSGLFYPIKNYFIKAKSILFSNILHIFNIELEGNTFAQNGHQFHYLAVPHLTEDEAWYGPIGSLLMLFASIVSFIRGIQKKDIAKIGIIFTSTIYAFCIILFRPGWDEYQGRYFLSTVVLVTPLINIYFSNKKIIQIIRSALIITAITIIATTHLLNEGKPIVVFENNPSLIRETIWNMDRIDKMTTQNRSLRYPLRTITSYIPDGSTIGLYINTGIWDYPFFQSDFSQRIVPIVPKDRLFDENWLSENDIDFVIINTKKEVISEYPNFLFKLFEYDNWILLENQH